MTLDDIVIRWLKILSWVKLRNTGDPNELARKLNISAVTLKRDIRMINKIIDSKLLEEVDRPIRYDRAEKSYVLNYK